MIIAVDGPAAAGKGTLARRLAHYYGLGYLDTGLLYRAVGRKMMDDKIPLTDQQQAGNVALSLTEAMLADLSLRENDAGQAASVVSAYPAVRQALLDFQRCFAHRPEGAVLDGRDIGTVIAPDAHIKFFVMASPQIRALRRHKEALERGEIITFEDILADVIERDERDASRKEAPLRPAFDAIILDTSLLDADEVFEDAIVSIRKMQQQS